MTIKERWDLAGKSELTIIGKLVIVLTILLLIIYGEKYTYFSIIQETDDIGIIIGVMVLLHLCIIVAIFICWFLLWCLIMLIDWITDYYIDWDNILEILIISYKFCFGDYEGKFDFIKGYFK